MRSFELYNEVKIAFLQANSLYYIYCTNWDGLKYDAECHHAQISKLMDSEIVYVNKSLSVNGSYMKKSKV